MKILIIEDDYSVRNYLKDKAKQINPNLEVESTDSASKALEIAQKYNIEAFFIDIQLSDYSGLEAAKQIRQIKKYLFTPMVFITAVPTRELEAFRQVHCYEYIIKPFTDKELENIFTRILVEYIEETEKNPDRISLDFKGVKQLLDTDDIVFIEYFFRKIIIHLKTSIIEYKHISLKHFKAQLPDNFLRIHQSFIVNKNYIRMIDNTNNFILLDYSDDKIPIGRSYKKEVGEWMDEAI